jgi:HD superfamily phosphohydrolase
VLRQRFPQDAGMTHLLDRIDSRQLYKPALDFTTSIGHDHQKEIVSRFHDNADERDRMERELAEAAGVEAHQIIVYCPSIGMALPEADVPVRWKDGNVLPLRSNNEEIRILRERHKALWRFYVLIDRSIGDKIDRIAKAFASRFFKLETL